MTELATSYDADTVRLPMSWEAWDSLDSLEDEYKGAEYMDGELIVVPGFPDWGHQQAIDHLREQIRPTLEPDEYDVTGFGWKPDGVKEEYGPDVMVCTRPDDPRRFTGVPRLCVEVTSANHGNDTVRKRNKYAAAGLPDYWIVDRRDRALRCYVLRGGVLAEVATISLAQHHGDTVTATYADRAVSLSLSRLFG